MAVAEQIAGRKKVAEALEIGEPVTLILAREGDDEALQPLIKSAESARIPVRWTSPAMMQRMTKEAGHSDILALVGRQPEGDLDSLLEGRGVLWMLCDVTYPFNIGYCIRTAEVSGATGVIITGGHNRIARREAVRTSMRADRFIPVVWEYEHGFDASKVVEKAKQSGFQVVAIEEYGDKMPWDVDLSGDVLFIVGSEREGIPLDVVEACHAVVKVPMAGFVPSHNLQAALAVVATESLRQRGY